MEKRLDKYNVAKESKFTRNRFKVTKLSIISYWGEKGTIPETLTVNLSKNTAWSLGSEIELGTTEENEAIVFEKTVTLLMRKMKQQMSRRKMMKMGHQIA